MKLLLIILLSILCFGGTPFYNTGVVGYETETEEIPSGVTLQTKATVSYDLKYVTLDMQPRLSNLIELRTFNYQQYITTQPATPNITGMIKLNP